MSVFTYLCTSCGKQAFKDPCAKMTDGNTAERPNAALGHWHCDKCGNKIKVSRVK
jgi:DNA-directed RNA polymerase subunit RPC12/RpoP